MFGRPTANDNSCRSHASRLASAVLASVLGFLGAAVPLRIAEADPPYPSVIDQAYAANLVGPGAHLIVVNSTIQAAIDSAAPGDVIFVPSGAYAENLTVSTPRLTIVGPNDAVLEGTGLPGPSGISVYAPGGATLKGFTLTGLTIQNYSQNGIFLRGVDHYSITSGRYSGNDDYGIFPVRSTNGLIANNVVSGSNDTGIYVGQSTNAVIRDNRTFGNTIGIEIENTLGASVVNNTSDDNSLGLLSDVLPGLSPKETTGVIATRNTIIDNNRPNPVTDPSDILSLLPAGVGALFVATNDGYVANNLITGNGSVGLGLISLPPAIAALDPSIDAIPDFDRFIGNLVTGNGLAPDPKLALLGFPPVDILWDGTGGGNVFRANVFGTSVPSVLPAPEPETVMLLGPMIVVLLGVRRLRTRSRGHPAQG